VNSSELQKEYELSAPLCEQFGRELTRQLEELLSEKNISLGFPLQCRVKKIDSILEKIERSSLEITHVQELNDLIGLRIILLFRRDVESVKALIKKNLKVFSEEDTQSRLGESEFGYSSVHFQVGLLSSWKKMPTFKKSGELRAEIQVRTVAQHIWATASHILQYKRETGVPPPVRRSIHRASALLETVDLEFERVLEERNSYLKRPKGNLSEDVLNVDLLAKILDELLPAKNKDTEEKENYADLLQDLFAFSIKSGPQLRDLLAENLEAVFAEEEGEIKQRLGLDKPAGTSKERIERGVFYTHVGLARTALRNKVGKRWTDYQKKKMEERKAETKRVSEQ
jgi:ppGpp synthetase/RelA/SpoT-type nucleotidyltranferase